MGLPGDMNKLTTTHDMCEEHEDRPATYKVQGETDSWGCEYIYMCDECVTALHAADTEKGICEWCNAEDVEIYPERDFEEGMHGPVYYVCSPCRQKQNSRISAELADMEDGDCY